MQKKSLSQNPLIFGHRGSSFSAPENTLIAFKKSYEDGADGIEFDVRLSKDGEVVVIHDASLKRTGGRNDLVSNLSAKELSRIDVGSWFNHRFPIKAKEEFSKATIPTLKEVFEEFKKDPYANADGNDFFFQLYVEMKCDAGEDYKVLVDAVAKEIHSHKIEKQVVVESFDLKAIKELKSIAPEIKTAALFEPKFLRLVRTKKRLIDEALLHDADEIAPHYTLATREMVKASSLAGLKTVIWTTDNPVWIQRAIKYGIHAVITNNPRIMIESMNQ